MTTSYSVVDGKLQITTTQSDLVQLITLTEAQAYVTELQNRKDEATASYTLEDSAYADKIAAAQAIVDACIANGVTI